MPVGPNSVSLTLGDECLGGCQASIVLSLPRPAAGDATSKVQAAVTPTADLVLPTSKLFDPLMPATASATVRLDVLEDNRLNVSVKVVVDEAGGASGGSPALPASVFKRTALGPDGEVLPVVRPGADADIEVTVRYCRPICSIPLLKSLSCSCLLSKCLMQEFGNEMDVKYTRNLQI